MGTTISTNDIRDGAIIGSKLSSNISIIGNLELANGTLRTPSDYNFLSILNSTGSSQGLATNKLIVSSSYSANWGKVPAIEGSAYFGGNVVIEGNLTIKGSSFIVDSETISMADNIIQLNSNLASDAVPTENAGIEINRGSFAKTQILWDEANDYWSLTNNGTNFYRIMDLNLADSKYVNIVGDTMTGGLIVNKPTGGRLIELYSTNTDSFLRMGYNSTTYSFDLKYNGSETGALNSLELWTDGTDASGAATKVFRVQQDGIFRVSKELDVTGNIVVSGTVDGVDIASHASDGITNKKHVTDTYLAALAGTTGTPSSTNKYVTNSDTRLTNSRTPASHGDTLHSALSYFDIVSDGTNQRSATTTKQNIKITGINGSLVTVSNDASYGAVVTIDSQHNHNTEYVKLANGTEQVIESNVKIDGNLYVTGTATYVNTEEMNVSNNIIILNSNLGDTESPTQDSGIEIERGNENNALIHWNEASNYFEVAERDITTELVSNRSRIVDLTLADSRYLKIADGGTISANITIGSIARDADSYVRVLSGNSNKAGFEAYGNTEGTGYVFVGASATYGGGVSYNGDNSPVFITGETADRVTFFRRTNNVNAVVFSYPHNSNTVYFNGNIVMSGTNTVDGVDVSALQSSYDTHIADINIHITSAERNTWNSKQAALGYSPVNKAGDTMTGALVMAGQDINMNRPNTATTWAKGINFRNRTGTAVESGIGSYGTGDIAGATLYMGFGTSPWTGSSGLKVTTTDSFINNNKIWHAGNFDPTSVDNYGGWYYKVDGTQYGPIGPEAALNFKAGSNISLAKTADNEITITGGQGYAGWKLQANGIGTSTIASNGTVNFVGAGGTVVTKSSNTITITSSNSSINNHLIFFSGTTVSQTLTHDFGIDPSLYIVCIGCNGPQRHVYYRNKTVNTVDIYIDHKLYTNEILEVSVSIQKI